MELARELKEIGAKQHSVYVWVHPICKGNGLKDLLDETDEWELRPQKGLSPFKKKEREMYAAFTVAELGEMLPPDYSTSKFIKGSMIIWCCSNLETSLNLYYKYAKREADARAKMWIFLKKKGLL